MHFVKAKGILSSGNVMNVYRGCTHGCIYCDARSRCYGMNHDFEDVEVKINAPELLEAALFKKRNKSMISTGAMHDPYMELEEDLRLTRKCAEVIDKYGFGFTVHTKSARVLRDIDLFQSINEKAKCVVQTTLTTYDEKLCRIIEPCVSTTKERFEALKELNKAGIETVVWLSPILPFINDIKENIEGILSYCAEAHVKGIICFGMGVTMRDGNREYFYDALDRFFPGIKGKYINKYGLSYENTSADAARLMDFFHKLCAKYKIMSDVGEIFNFLGRFESKYLGEQISMF